MSRYSTIAFTKPVKAVQERMGSLRVSARASDTADPDPLTADEVSFIASRDSFYLASVGESGWPYIQHRGGPQGFVRALDQHTLGFADFRGNRQYVSVGNVEHNDRVALFFVDYPHRIRLKIFAHASLITKEKDAPTLSLLADESYVAEVERGFVLRVEGFDWNCQQHITRRLTEAEIAAVLQPTLEELRSLEQENKELRERLGMTTRIG